MLSVEYTAQFKKDLKLLKRRGKDLDLLKHTIEKIQHGKSLPQKLKDHALKGKWAHHRECHLEPDWLLVYKILAKENTLILVRSGTHSDLF